MSQGLRLLFLIFLGMLIFSVQASAQTYNFTTCGAEGREGPSESDCESEYEGTSLAGIDVEGNGIQTWEVPESDEYRITAYGSQGPDQGSGWGAVVSGTFELEGGEELKVITGQQGSSGSRDAAGGGGTYVYADVEGTPYLVAGGGGGGTNTNSNTSRQHGQTTTYGANGLNCANRGSGGTDGSGGDSSSGNSHGGGAGWIGQGGDSGGGDPPRDGALGGSETYDGGFGGGGGASTVSGFSYTGGGGGYSGGGVSRCTSSSSTARAGGGGSFIEATAEDPATSDGNWETTGNEPNSVYKGEVESLNEFNEGHGTVLIERGGSDFCNFRGPINECLMNETNQLQEQEYNISSVFESRSNAVFEAFQGPATLTIDNTTSISGLWKGNINIESERTRLEAGAQFQPEGEKIVIGN